MRAIRLHGQGDVRVHDEPEPVPAEGEALVAVSAVGLCGSDLHWYTEGHIGDAHLERPIVPGHEFFGVARTGKYAGQRVIVEPSIACNHCQYCHRGDHNLCENGIFAGHGSRDGGMQEVIAWPERCLTPIPDEVSDDDAVTLEPLGVALHAFDLSHIKAGWTIGVVGCGPIGLLLLQLVRNANAVGLIAVEPREHRRAKAAELGARTVLAPEEVGSYGNTCDLVFDVSGSAEAVAEALTLAKPGARIVLVGIPDDDTTTFRASVARRKAITFVEVRRMKEVYDRAIPLLATGLVNGATLVSHAFGPDRADDAFRAAAAREGHKVVIKMQPGAA